MLVGSGSVGPVGLLRKLSVVVPRNDVRVLRSLITLRVDGPPSFTRVRLSVARVLRLELSAALVSEGTLLVLRVVRVLVRCAEVAARLSATREVPGAAREIVGTPLLVVREGAGR